MDGIEKFVLLMFGIVAAAMAVSFAIPIFSVWLLFKGWDNAGVLLKALAIGLPLAGVFTLFTQNEGAGLTSNENLFIIGALIVNYGLITIAYMRRQFVGG